MLNKYTALCLLWAALPLTGCNDQPLPPKGGDTHEEAPPALTNRIDVPQSVRKNLGISFAKVERRPVKVTVRIPGRFELKPSARREYHATLPGHVTIAVDQYSDIEPGQILGRLNSPQWHELRQSLSQEQQAILEADTRLAANANRLKAATAHRDSLAKTRDIWTQRLSDLQKLVEAGGGGGSSLTEARAQVAATHTATAEVDEEIAELEKEQSELQVRLNGARQRNPILHASALSNALPSGPTMDLALSRAAALSGYSLNELIAPVPSNDQTVPNWQFLETISIRSDQPGVVEKIAATNGAWVETGALILSTVDLNQIRFRAVAVQSDLGKLKAGLPATIAPPQDGPASLQNTLAATIRFGTEADPDQRTIDILAEPEQGHALTWARPGVSAFLEIVTNPLHEAALAIPASAIIQDGLSKVFFRRDPHNPDKVIRMEADAGTSDGRWVEILSGIADGDEVVLHGAYELMLAGSDQAKGGHFHSDGTFHSGKDK